MHLKQLTILKNNLILLRVRFSGEYRIWITKMICWKFTNFFATTTLRILTACLGSIILYNFWNEPWHLLIMYLSGTFRCDVDAMARRLHLFLVFHWRCQWVGLVNYKINWINETKTNASRLTLQVITKKIKRIRISRSSKLNIWGSKLWIKNYKMRKPLQVAIMKIVSYLMTTVLLVKFVRLTFFVCINNYVINAWHLFWLSRLHDASICIINDRPFILLVRTYRRRSHLRSIFIVVLTLKNCLT